MASQNDVLVKARALITAALPTVATAGRLFSPGKVFDPATLRDSPGAWVSIGPPAEVFDDTRSGRITYAVAVDCSAVDYATAHETADTLKAALRSRLRAPGPITNITSAGPFRERNPDYYREAVRFTLTVTE
jgi:hypothetical protein